MPRYTVTATRETYYEFEVEAIDEADAEDQVKLHAPLRTLHPLILLHCLPKRQRRQHAQELHKVHSRHRRLHPSQR